MKVQAVELPNTRKSGYSGVYRNVDWQNGLATTCDPDCFTMYDLFQKSVQQYGKLHCLGHREWQQESKKWSKYTWESYQEIATRRDQFGSGLIQLYQKADRDLDELRSLGIFAKNRPQWVIADLAAHAFSLATVALYDTLGAESTEYIINHTQMPVIVSSLEHIPSLIRLKAKSSSLKYIISMDPLAQEEGLPGMRKIDLLNAWAIEAGVEVLTFTEVQELGRANLQVHRPPTPSTLATINYTSGTTGMPKGALLSHKNFVAALTTPFSLARQVPGDVYISYLPLAHIFDRVSVYTALASGTAIGFFHGDFPTLLEDIQMLKPTVMCSVPRILTRIAYTMQAATVNAPGVKGRISQKAYAAKLAKMEAGGDSTHPLWDIVWSRKIKAALGGRLRLIITGSAPIPNDSLQFLRAALACQISDGYGLTETTACATISLVGDCTAGHVGPPVPCAEIRLKDVPDMGYRSTDKPNPRGELLIRGPHIFLGYYKDEAKTKEALDSDGWFSSGDVCEIDEFGRCYIIDRVKSFLKLSQGEYVSPGRIESYYGSSELIGQIFIHGDSLESYLVAIVGPNPDSFAPWVSKIVDKEISPTDIDELNVAAKDLNVRRAFMQVLDNISKQKKLAGFERAKNVYLQIEPFQVDGNELLTPTLKLKRPQAAKFYRREINAMYKEGPINVVQSKL